MYILTKEYGVEFRVDDIATHSYAPGAILCHAIAPKFLLIHGRDNLSAFGSLGLRRETAVNISLTNGTD